MQELDENLKKNYIDIRFQNKAVYKLKLKRGVVVLKNGGCYTNINVMNSIIHFNLGNKQ